MTRNGGLARFAEKFGSNVALPQGLVFAVRPLEVHFVDYTYEAVTAARRESVPQISSRRYQLEESSTPGTGRWPPV